MDDTADEQSAFSAGWDAHQRGKKLDDNPHSGDMIEFEWWSQGWRAREKKLPTIVPPSKYPKVNPRGS